MEKKPQASFQSSSKLWENFSPYQCLNQYLTFPLATRTNPSDLQFRTMTCSCLVVEGTLVGF